MFHTRSLPPESALVAHAGRSALFWGQKASAPKRIDLFDLSFANQTMNEAVDELVHCAAGSVRLRVVFANAHVINTLAADAGYARVLAGADRIFADGSGMALAARLAGRSLVDNVNGTDMFPLLCAAAIAAGQTIFLLGGKPGVTQAAVATLTRIGLEKAIAGVHHGYVKRGGHEEAEAIRLVNESGASILLVGMGVPVQDIWIARNFPKLNTPVVAGVGGLFDFFAGNVSRAPVLLRRFGFEWVWRLAQEPGRMWQRYLLGNVTFMARAALQAADLRWNSGPAHRSNQISRWSALHASLRARLLSHIPAFLKRCMDVSAVLCAFMLLAVPVLLVALAIKLDSKGPVLFRQTRVGLNGRTFEMLKFRSMFVNADSLHKAMADQSGNRHLLRFKDRRDPRVTRVGRIIRRASIDEIPQLWNVFRGDMSIVGPRPALPSEVAKYTLRDRDRLLAKPGITCTWQVSGRANIDFVGQVELDRDYVRNRSVWRDIMLILRTIPAVISGRGAY